MKRYVGVIVVSLAVVIGLIYFSLDRILPEEATTDPADDKEGLVTFEEEGLPEEARSNEVKAEVESTSSVIVDVKGSVAAPGVYDMTEGDRIHDVIQLAGGFTKEANEAVVNLAQKLQDEMVIVVPKEGEEVTEDILSTSSPSGSGLGEAAGDKINLNQATESDLESLNGIGPAKAQAIIDYREEHGAFQEIEDLLEVSGIGEKTLESFQDELIVP